MIPERYSLENLSRVAKNPRLLLGEAKNLKRSAYHFPLTVNSQYYKFRSAEPTLELFKADWDNCVILDACRPDILREIAPDEWSIETRISPATYSYGFMDAEFLPEEHHDTVYITTNPHAPKLPDDLFHATHNLLESHWNEDHRTVMPEDVVSETIRLAEDYEDKRLLIHFMQPHFPFLGPTGQTLDHAGIEMWADDDGGAPHPWFKEMYYGGVGRDRLLTAYQENHEIALKHTQKLVETLSGRSVVTADHANLIGERGFPIPFRMYGHPPGVPKRELVEVPWVEFDGNSREHVTEPPAEQALIEADVAKDRLRQLGYVE